MFNAFTLYIGSNNETKLLELEKITAILDSYFEGYTLLQAKGVWKGEHETTAVVEVSTEKDILPVIEELKTELHQDAIAWRVAPVLNFN
jgi:hypothetical protein